MGWIRPGVLGGLAGEAPDVEVAEASRPHRGQQQLVTVRAHRYFLVGRGRVAQLRDEDGRAERVAVIRHRNSIDVEAAAGGGSIEVHEGVRLSWLMHGKRAP